MEHEGVLFRRMPHPGLGLVDHAARIGVRLKSSGVLETGSQTSGSRLSQRSSAHTATTSRVTSRTPMSSRARTTPHRVLPPNTPPVTYIHNIVVPLHAPLDEMNLANTTTSHAFRSLGSRSRLTMRGKSPALASASTTHNSGTRSCVTAQSQADPLEVTPVPTDTASNKSSGKWNRSEQAMRFASEQDDVTKSRTRKRTSEASPPAGFTCYDDPDEIQPHRVDRAYYMSGTNISLRNRYAIDEAELSQLKEMASARRQTKHYGRGLSRQHGDVTCATVLHNSEVPRQPPPSSMGDAETVADGLLTEDAVINDTQTVVTEDQQAVPLDAQDEGIGLDASPPDQCDLELADVEGSACGHSQGQDRLSETKMSESQPPEPGLLEPVLPGRGGEDGDLDKDQVESSLETQRDSASMPMLDSSRHTGAKHNTRKSMLTLNSTEASTARSDPWKGALLEREAEIDAEIHQSQGIEQNDHSEDLRMDQSENVSQSADLDMDQSQAPEEIEVQEDISVSPKDAELSPEPAEPEQSQPAAPEQPAEEPCNHSDPVNEAKSEPSACNGELPPLQSQNTSPCEELSKTTPTAEITPCGGPVKDTGVSQKVQSNQKSKPRPLSPCQGH